MIPGKSATFRHLQKLTRRQDFCHRLRALPFGNLPLRKEEIVQVVLKVADLKDSLPLLGLASNVVPTLCLKLHCWIIQYPAMNGLSKEALGKAVPITLKVPAPSVDCAASDTADVAGRFRGALVWFAGSDSSPRTGN